MPAFQPPSSAAPAPAPAEAASDVEETIVLGRPDAAAAAVPAAPAEVQAELTIETGPDAGHGVKVGAGAVRIGRSPDNDLILRDPATSGHHARLERRGTQFWIVDLGSTNGTLVNGEPVQEKELQHGDRVTLGQNAVKFSLS